MTAVPSLVESGPDATLTPAHDWADDELVRFFKLSLDLFAILDFDGSFLRVNPAWERALGFSPEELYCRPARDLIHPDDRDMPATERRKLFTGFETVTYRNRQLCKDGSYRWILWNATVSVRRRKIYAVGRDVTDELAAEQKILALVADLERKNEALIQAQRQKEAMTAYIVHDLKNPLAAISANVGYLLGEPALGPNSRTAARDALIGAESMDRMIMNLLDLSRSEEGALEPRRIVFDLAEVMQEVKSTMARQASLCGRSIEISAEPAELPIRADRDLVRRLIGNLVDNGLRYTPSGTAIRIEARASDDQIALCVRDQGPGVPSEHSERIFEKYAQLRSGGAEPARTSRGMGLAFCRVAAEAHGGRIWVQPDEPTGSAFHVSLPVG